MIYNYSDIQTKCKKLTKNEITYKDRSFVVILNFTKEKKRHQFLK